MAQPGIRRLDDKLHKASPLTMLSPQSLPNPGEPLLLFSPSSTKTTKNSNVLVPPPPPSSSSLSMNNGNRTPSYGNKDGSSNENTAIIDDNHTASNDNTDNNNSSSSSLLSIFTSELLANEIRVRKVFYGIARRPDESINLPLSPLSNTTVNRTNDGNDGSTRQPLRTPQRPVKQETMIMNSSSIGTTVTGGETNHHGTTNSTSSSGSSTVVSTVLGSGTPQRNYSSLAAQPVTITSPHKPTENSVPRAKRSNIREEDISFVRNTVGTPKTIEIVGNNSTSNNIVPLPIVPSSTSAINTVPNTLPDGSPSLMIAPPLPNSGTGDSTNDIAPTTVPSTNGESTLSSSSVSSSTLSHPSSKVSVTKPSINPYNIKLTIRNDGSSGGTDNNPSITNSTNLTSPSSLNNNNNPQNLSNLSASARRSTKPVPTYALNTLAWSMKQEDSLSMLSCGTTAAVTVNSPNRSSSSVLSPSSSSKTMSPKPTSTNINSTNKGKVKPGSSIKNSLQDAKSPLLRNGTLLSSPTVVVVPPPVPPILTTTVERSASIGYVNDSGITASQSANNTVTANNNLPLSSNTASTGLPDATIPSVSSTKASSSIPVPVSSPASIDSTINDKRQSITTILPVPLNILPSNSFNDAPAIIAPPLLSSNLNTTTATGTTVSSVASLPSNNPLSPFRVRLLPYSTLNSMNSNNNSSSTITSVVPGSFSIPQNNMNANIIQHQLRLRAAQEEYQKLHQQLLQQHQMKQSLTPSSMLENNASSTNPYNYSNLSSLPTSEGPSPVSTRPSSIRLPNGSPVSNYTSLSGHALPHSALSPVYGPQHAHLPLYTPLIVLDNAVPTDSSSTNSNGLGNKRNSSTNNLNGNTATHYPKMHVALVPMRETTGESSPSSTSTSSTSAFERTLGNLHINPEFLPTSIPNTLESPYLGPSHPFTSPSVANPVVPSQIIETDAVSAAAVLMERLNSISTAVETIREVIQHNNPNSHASVTSLSVNNNIPVPLLSQSSSVPHLDDTVVEGNEGRTEEENLLHHSSGQLSPLHVTSRAESTGYSENTELSPPVNLVDQYSSHSNVSTYSLPSPSSDSNVGRKSPTKIGSGPPPTTTTVTGTILSGPVSARGIPSPIRHRPGTTSTVNANNYPSGKKVSPVPSTTTISTTNTTDNPAWMGDGSEALLRSPVPIPSLLTNNSNVNEGGINNRLISSPRTKTGTTSSSPSSATHSKSSSPVNKTTTNNNTTTNNDEGSPNNTGITAQWQPGISNQDTSANAVVAQLQYELRNELLALLGNEEEMNRLLNGK